MLAGAEVEHVSRGRRGRGVVRLRNESANDQSDYLAGYQLGKLAEKRLKSITGRVAEAVDTLQSGLGIPCKCLTLDFAK